MTVFLVCAGLALAVGVFLAMPLRAGARRAPATETDHLAAQLAEVDRDLVAGALPRVEADAARLEAKRRLLASVRAGAPKIRTGGAAAQRAAIAVALAAPSLAALLYLDLGNPARAPTDRARALVSIEGPGEVGLDALEAHVKSNPGDVEALAMLGEAYMSAERFADAAAAFERAARLAPQRADVHAMLGEALFVSEGGDFTDAARAAFAKALESDPKEPRARFYSALARERDGDGAGALAALIALAEDAPVEAEWLPVVGSELARLAAANGRTPIQAGLSPVAANRIAEATRRAEAQLPSALGGAEQRAAIDGMVQGLVSRLESAPEDFDGWMMLGRSYAVLGEAEKSADAYGRAVKLRPRDLDALLGRAQAMIAVLGDAEAPFDEATRAVLEQIVKIEPDHPFANFFLGVAAREKGDAAAARRAFEKTLKALPPGSEEAARVRALIDAL